MWNAHIERKPWIGRDRRYPPTLHAYPLSVIAWALKSRTQTIDPDCIVAQRLKRFPSIRNKLRDQPGMALTRMQDIAGCRAILDNTEQIYQLKRLSEETAAESHLDASELISSATKDYIAQPKTSGYRGVHLVMKYRAAVTAPPKEINGLRVELQIRLSLQQAWAMAVETVAASTNQALKSIRGNDEWKRFFLLMSSAMALKEECPVAPGTPSEPMQIYQELRSLTFRLKAIPFFAGIGHIIERLGVPTERPLVSKHLYVLVLEAGKTQAFLNRSPWSR